jgi:hypothetical protein
MILILLSFKRIKLAINENENETNIGDEVVVTNPNQVLPRYLIYFKKK